MRVVAENLLDHPAPGRALGRLRLGDNTIPW
jgi:hypothetical protein